MLAEHERLRPDPKFVEAILSSGGGDLKKCFQCATCSAVCELSSPSSPFPRKEMHWAQWGLKERLLADPDVWLCFQCGDCSLRCPRQARPSDVLAAVRRQVVRHYAFPRFLSDWVDRPATFPLLLAIPVVLLGAAVLARGSLTRALGMQPPTAFYAAFFPDWMINVFFTFFVVLALIAAVSGMARFWRAMRQADAASGRGAAATGVVTSIVRALRTILLHDRFGACGRWKSRQWTHLFAFYGFLALLVTTIWAVFNVFIGPAFGLPVTYPFAITYPAKYLANLGALLLLVGAGKAIWERARDRDGAGSNTTFDWSFTWLLLALGVTGVAVEVLRYAGQPAPSAGLTSTAYALYFVHLVLVFSLLVYLPYSKFAHLLYRSTALVYAERTGRRQSAAVPKAAVQPGPAVREAPAVAPAASPDRERRPRVPA